MPFVKCKHPDCQQLLDVNCNTVVTMLRNRFFLEHVCIQLADGTPLWLEAKNQLTHLEDKISELNFQNIENWDTNFNLDSGVNVLPAKGGKPALLTLKCPEGHTFTYETECP